MWLLCHGPNIWIALQLLMDHESPCHMDLRTRQEILSDLTHICTRPYSHNFGIPSS